YADVINKGANAMMAAMGFDKIAQGGIALRQSFQMQGFEMRTTITQIAEEAAPEHAYEIPPYYKEVPLPSGGRYRRGDWMRRLAIWVAAVRAQLVASAQVPPRDQATTILRPARVFDGDAVHEGWAVRVQGDRIQAVGPAAGVSAPGAAVVDLPGTTLL